GLRRHVASHALEKERWFDRAAMDALARYDVEMSPSPDAYLQRYLAALENERNRFAGRVRDLALEKALLLPEHILERLRQDATGRNLREIDALFTGAFFRVSQALDPRKALAQKLRSDWQRSKQEGEAKAAKLKALVSEKGARLKHGSETEAKIKDVFRTVVCRELIEQSVTLTAAEALAEDQSLESRL